MTIRGLGTDIVDTRRIRRALARHGERFARRVLTDHEFDRYGQFRDPAPYLARRFAAKEAAAKALGTGIAAGVRLTDIEVQTSGDGRPRLRLTGAARYHLEALGAGIAHVSLSDERCFAVAVVVLES